MQKASNNFIIITGAAGFIGSNIALYLNKKGIQNLILVDHLTKNKKENIKNLQYDSLYGKDAFLKRVQKNALPEISAIIHMGACSDTKEYDKKYLKENNYVYSQALFRYAHQHNIQFIYASSGAVYGDGKKGYKETAKNLHPLNPYGYYKYLFDKWVLRQKNKPKQWVGLRFFNVYGPNEYHKGSMASVVYHGFHQIKENNKIELFKSHNKKYKDGMQVRDFVYIEDVVRVVDFFLNNPSKSGIFNVGTGKAESFLDLAKATFLAMKKTPKIQFIDMPQVLRKKYQYFTQANVDNLRKAGYKKKFTSLKRGISDYVANYLLPKSL